LCGTYFTGPSYHTLGLTLAGIGSKRGVVNGRIAIREYLHLTISVDHDIVDGAPAARFAQQLRELIERGFGLCDQDVRVVTLRSVHPAEIGVVRWQRAVALRFLRRALLLPILTV